MMIVNMLNDVCDGDDVLAGAAAGAEALSRLIGHFADQHEPMVVVLDFSGIDIATASFLREAVLGFRDYCRNSRENLYPVLAGLGVKVREELDGLLKLKGEALILCDLTPKGAVKNAVVIGMLDAKQQATLNAVVRAGKADAVSLAKIDPLMPNPTTWNNRLAGLAAKGLLRETQNGRAKIYTPVVEALTYGYRMDQSN